MPDEVSPFQSISANVSQQLRHAVVRDRLRCGRVLQRLEGLRSREHHHTARRVGNPPSRGSVVSDVSETRSDRSVK